MTIQRGKDLPGCCKSDVMNIYQEYQNKNKKLGKVTFYSLIRKYIKLINSKFLNQYYLYLFIKK